MKVIIVFGLNDITVTHHYGALAPTCNYTVFSYKSQGVKTLCLDLLVYTVFYCSFNCLVVLPGYRIFIICFLSSKGGASFCCVFVICLLLFWVSQGDGSSRLGGRDDGGGACGDDSVLLAGVTMFYWSGYSGIGYLSGARLFGRSPLKSVRG